MKLRNVALSRRPEPLGFLTFRFTVCFRRESSARDGKGVEAFSAQFVIPYEWLVSRLLRVLEGWNIAGLFFFGRLYVALRV